MKAFRAIAAALVLLGSTAPGAVAQLVGEPVRIGYLDGAGESRWYEAFRRGLGELGYVEGRSIVVDRLSLEGRSDRLQDLVGELVRRAPRVIVVSGSRPAAALKEATATIPIVITFATDPVGLGLAESLARPGGNLTGLSNLGAGLMGKRLELLAELAPGLSRFGVVWTPIAGALLLDYRELDLAAERRGVTLRPFEVSRPDGYDAALAAASQNTGAVAVLSGPMAFANRHAIVAAAARHRVRAIYYDAEYAEAGGLISYGPSLRDLHRRAAVYVDKIIKGAKPGDLPIEEPTRFELVVNLRTARALDITIPASILARADEVIE